jgi:putative ubiquitin-RnfH superfamily antitoxin RatB of RatAB toxin-antitoxin module
MAEKSGGHICIEVAYALPDVQTVIEVQVPAGATVAQAIECSGIVSRHPEIDLTRTAVGVFGRPKSLQAALSDGDRVEIYRPMIADPKQARRSRARRRR